MYPKEVREIFSDEEIDKRVRVNAVIFCCVKKKNYYERKSL